MGRVGAAAMAVVGLVAVAAVAVAGVAVGRRVRSRRRWSRVLGVLSEFEEACETPVGKLKQVEEALNVEMHAGLASEGGSKLKMLLTFVDNLPNGNEKGIYYALDLGGTDFRLLQVQLGDRMSSPLPQFVEQKPIPQNLMTSTSEDLFDYITTSLKEFLETKENSLGYAPKERRELGFTVSFPVKQTSVSSGILLRWTKGFAIHDMVGKDIAESLQLALTRNGLNMEVVVLVNDTVGALALGRYYDPDTVAAVIIGTGANACYVERTDAIIKCQGLATTSGYTVVNMGWGNFWCSHLPRTSYDIDLDAQSPNHNEQGFEKMISGMYLGEIVRRVILRMSQETDIFSASSSKLSIPFILSTPLMAAMHEDNSPDLREVDKKWREMLEVPEVPNKVRKLIVKLCDIVTRRAARLAAAGIAGILKKIGRDGGSTTGGRSRGDVRMKRTVVVVEGALFANYAMFREYLLEALREILGEDIAQHVILRFNEDGSGLGAALLAASHSSTPPDTVDSSVHMP